MIFNHIINTCVYEDPTFPKGFDPSPCTDTLTKIKLLDLKSDLVYKQKTKQQPAELFLQKTAEARDMPDHTDVVACLNQIRDGIEDSLRRM